MTDKESKPAIQSPKYLRLAGRIAHSFIDSKLTPLVIVGALILGAFSILKTPREEEPQIVVPMLDVFVQMPGASAEEVAQASAFLWRSYCAKCRAWNTSIRSVTPA